MAQQLGDLFLLLTDCLPLPIGTNSVLEFILLLRGALITLQFYKCCQHCSKQYIGSVHKQTVGSRGGSGHFGAHDDEDTQSVLLSDPTAYIVDGGSSDSDSGAGTGAHHGGTAQRGQVTGPWFHTERPGRLFISNIKKETVKGDCSANGNKYKIALANLAKQYLTPPPTSTTVERLFSQGSNFLTEHRESLSPDTVQMLMFFRSNVVSVSFELD